MMRYAMTFLLSALFMPYSVFAGEDSSALSGMNEATVESRLLYRERRFFSTVEYPIRFRIFAPEASRLKRNRIREGQVYPKDDILLELRNERLHVDLLQRKSDVLEAGQALSRLQIGLRHGQSSQQEVKRAEEKLEIAQAHLGIAEESFNSLIIRAPFQGRVIRVSAKLAKSGEQNVTEFAQGELLAEYVNDDALVLRGRLELPVGSQDPAAFKASIEDGGRLVEAKILSVHFTGPGDGKADQFEITLAMPDDADMQPLGGMIPARLLLPGKFAPRCIPRSFVLSKGDLRYCLVQRGGKAVEVNIMLGEYDDEHIEVFGELTPGETLLSNTERP